MTENHDCTDHAVIIPFAYPCGQCPDGEYTGEHIECGHCGETIQASGHLHV